MVCNESGQIQDLLLYMRECTIEYCKFAGAEARSNGNLIMEDCSVANNLQGVALGPNGSKVLLNRCNIFNNTKEGIISYENYTYDNSLTLVVKESKIHHNQLGMSLQFTNSINICDSKIFSNRSWGVALRNARFATFVSNEIFRNECGGLRVCLNRFPLTLLRKNRIFDHTGPGVMHTVFNTENEMFLKCDNLDRDANSVKIILLDNLAFNNELQYTKVGDIKSSADRCALCSKKCRSKMLCKKCQKVSYCSKECQQQHYINHRSFCEFFQREHIFELTINRVDFEPSNRTIENHRAKKSMSFYKKKEFLVKVNHGDTLFGLQEPTQLEQMADILLDHPQASEIKKISEKNKDNLCIYDKFRNISGITTNDKLVALIRSTGRLSGDQIYNKRVYLWASLVRHKDKTIVINVKTDKILHDLGW